MNENPNAKKSNTLSEFEQLQLENKRQQKTIDVLIHKMEEDSKGSGKDYSIFQTAVNLEKIVLQRTQELNDLNERLNKELEYRLQFEEELKIAKITAEQADKIKSVFLAATSHDLREPLNAARLFLGALAQSGLTGPQADQVTKIKKSLLNVTDILNTLLNISQLDGGAVTPRFCHFQIGDLFERVVADYQAAAKEKGLSLKWVRSTQIVHSDPQLLEVAIRNFLSNAVKYTLQGKVLLGARKKGRFLHCEIWDTGVGIADENRKYIFQVFKRFSEDAQIATGVGLGLSITERISKLLNHEISLSSSRGVGSMFSLQVPLGDPKRALNKEKPINVNGANLRGMVVTVVDDNVDVLEAMRSLLSSWGVVPVCYTLPELALEDLIENDLSPDLIIADYHLEGDLKGPQVIQEINSEFSNSVPAIITTSDLSNKTKHILENSPWQYLYKPIRSRDLREILVSARS